jgi:NDP-sugar pyrophosphorylase family protein
MNQLDAIRPLENIEALVLAGGLGTRISTVLPQTPKLLAPLAGRPYLDYLVGWLAGYGVARLVLSLGHLAEKVIGHIERNPYPDIEIVPVVEANPLGTAGGIAWARKQLHSDPVLVINGDSYVDADLGTFLEFHRLNGFGASLVCTMVDNASRYGSVEIDENLNITAFREKNTASDSAGYISSGVYLLSANALDAIAALGIGSVERDFFAVQSQISLGGFAGHFNFVDFGTPESLETAQGYFADLGIISNKLETH